MLFQLAYALVKKITFQQDNDPKHSFKFCQNYHKLKKEQYF